MLKNKDIICISTSDWLKPWGSKQQIMSRLSNTNRVLYIEYQASFLHPLRYPTLWHRYAIYPNGVIRKESNSLFIYTPPPLLPFGVYCRAINKINQYLLCLFIKRVLKKVGFNDYILWIYPPWSVDLIDRLKPRRVIYHCIDDVANEKRIFIRRKTLENMEDDLLKKAQYVFVLSEGLFKKFINRNQKTYYLPSGVDERFFNIDYGISLPDIDRINNPRLGIIGIFNERLDVDLIKHTAKSHSDWSIILIGPVVSNKKKIFSLRCFPNVYFLGWKNFERIPYYVKKLDVGLIPYKVNKFTNNISPLKLYEYLALGKPAVSTDLAEIRRYKEVLKIAKDKYEFVTHISDLLTKSTDNLAEIRSKIARENIWDNRLETIRKVLAQE